MLPSRLLPGVVLAAALGVAACSAGSGSADAAGKGGGGGGSGGGGGGTGGAAGTTGGGGTGGGAGGAIDAGADVHSECAGLVVLAIAAPQITSGRLVPGASATLQLTLTNTGSSDYTKYPGAILSTTTPGISFATDQATVALLAAAQSRALSWSVAVAPSVPAATTAAFAAHVIGGGALDCPDASSVEFSYAVESP